VNKPASLQELAELAITKQGMSARQVALKAERSGYGLTHTTLNQMRKGTYKSEPREDTLRALAWLAGVSDKVAFAAAGKKIPGPPLADELPPGSDNLSPRSRKVIVDMLRVLIELEDNANELPTAELSEEDSNVTKLERPDDHSQGPKPEQKIPVPLDPAAHPPMELAADREDAYFDELGEESQDGEN
jgi:hypothetical protein